MDRARPSSISPADGNALNANAPTGFSNTGLNATAAEFTPPFRKKMLGAVVEFGPGGAVTSVKLPTDNSSVQINGLDPGQASIYSVSSLLAGTFGLSYDDFSVELHEHLSLKNIIAIVKFNGSRTAQIIVDQAKHTLIPSNITIKEIPLLCNDSEWIQLDTVKVYWAKTGRMAFVEYRANTPGLDILPTVVSGLLTPSGRHVKCVSLAESGYEAGRSIRSVSLNNLDEDADYAWVETTLLNAGFPAPKKVKIKDVNAVINASDDFCVRVMEDFLRSIGSLEAFQVGESVDGARIICTATFCNSKGAGKAIEILRSKNDLLPGFDTKNLTIEPVVSMKVNFQRKLAAALEPQLEAMRIELQKDGKDKLKIYSEGRLWNFWSVRFSHTGDDALKVISTVKARIEKLLAGTTVCDRGIPLWHPWFATSPNVDKFLKWLSFETKVVVLRSIALGQLAMYGGTFQQRCRACTILKDKVRVLNHETAYTIFPAPGMNITETLDILKPVFKDKIFLRTTNGPPDIKLCGSIADLNKANLLLNPDNRSTGKDCVICWTAPASSEDMISLPCGHIYCRECFNAQFNTTDQSCYPLTCAGTCSDDTNCKYLFEMKLLREELSAEKFETVMRMCLDMYIRSHSDELSYCPFQDCPTIYSPIPRNQKETFEGTAPSVTCTSCLHTICSSCRALHSGLTCKEFIDATDGQDALNAYLSDPHNETKTCPSCKIITEKRPATCNHMHCASCGEHYCWVCLYIAKDSQDAYKHLFDAHGGHGLDDEPLDAMDHEDGDDELEEFDDGDD